MSEPQSLSPTPVKYPGLSLLAKGLAGVNSFATAEDKAVPGKKANALLSGLASMVGLPEAQALMEKLAYGERLTTGKGQTLKPAENVVEGALALAPLAQGLARGAMKVAGKIPTQLDSSPNALVWHGSPHQFDKFDSSKIGTGEGAQAYGHGLYLADKRSVAEEYKRALSAGRGDSDDDTIARVLDAIGNPANAADELERRARYANIPGGSDRLRSLAEKIRSGHDPRGSLYQVDLPDDQIAKMLDYDATLGGQPEIAAKLFGAGMQHSLYRKNGSKSFKDFTGADVMRSTDSHSRALLADDLAKLDIPGVKYLDGNSRPNGQGSSNYVIFPGNEAFLQILERNGIPLNKGLARGAVKVAGKIPTQRDSDLAALFGPKVFGNLPAAPGTAEVPEGFVRLYHQTSPKAAKAIKRTGLSIEHAKGIEGPRAIYASETGFYGDPSKRPTVEFQIPKDQFESPFVLKDISPDELTAVHLPWHDKARYILENPKTLEQTLAGQFDNLDGDYAKAVRYIKQNYPKLTKGLVGK